MRCGDLERYLEAFLDGRLNRGRRIVLRRHLALCGTCQTRVERLRQFERETQRRFRALEEPGSVWAGLALDLVGSQEQVGEGRLLALPRPSPVRPWVDRLPSRAAPDHALARRPRVGQGPGRAAASRLAGVVLIAMAIGSVYQLARGERVSSPSRWATRAYVDQQTNAIPDLPTADARRAGDWLAVELGRPVSPPPVPAGYHLLGVSRVEREGSPSAAVIYVEDDGAGSATVMLFVRPTSERESSPTEMGGEAGLHELAWRTDSLGYAVVGPVPAEQLRLFAP